MATGVLDEHGERDDLIGDVARAMTHVAPPEHLRAEVMARVGPRRQWSMSHVRTAAALAAAMLAVVIWRTAGRPEQSSAPPAVRVATASRGAARGATAEAARAATRAVPSGRASIARAGGTARGRPVAAAAVAPPATAAELAWRARALDWLAPVEPIALEDIQPAPLQVPLLSRVPDEIVPLSIQPLAAATADLTPNVHSRPDPTQS